MKNDLVKIPVMAEELEVAYKTIYTWISDGHLEMVKPGYVLRRDAYRAKQEARYRASAVQKKRVMSSQGIKRDAYGRFKKVD